ncbi:MAG TPA: hypothetical protein VGC41_22195, partial [Kofleriaceae bacterium]
MRTSAFLGAMVCVVACGKSGTQAQPGAVAGNVLEVSGKVTVAGTALSVGDPVKSDAVVETADDGHVVIELAHNQARWELGPNQKKKPTESLAWNQPKGSGSAAGTEQATSAAGRPAERSAADTATTAPDRGGPPPAQAAQPEAARPQAQPQAPEPTTGGPGAAAPPP